MADETKTHVNRYLGGLRGGGGVCLLSVTRVRRSICSITRL
jgi:hypothetical protein